ncbi:hypothetical protein FJZ27_04405 [Candidatus Peribacteria bacterium]|nr:hypothetical protein [Candidatus Peribacteria bacterium]
MRFRSSIIALVGTCVALRAVPTHAARNIQPPDVATSIHRTCKKFTEQDNVRCKDREERKWWQSLKLVNRPKRHYEFLEKQDFGQVHLRETIRAERSTANRKITSERKTYRQLRPTKDVNTERRDYLNDLKMERLECQLKPPGRQRSLCIDQVGNWARRQMQQNAPSRRLPAS